jgi:transposase InsO family protein
VTGTVTAADPQSHEITIEGRRAEGHPCSRRPALKSRSTTTKRVIRRSSPGSGKRRNSCLDTKKLARFRRVGHRITGDRRHGSDGAGWEFVHVAVDDASRLAYVEVLPDERRQSVTGFLVRALRWFRSLGIRVERVMTDNGSGYVSRLFRKACRMLRLRHLRTRPYTPKTNGKAERFIQTLLREWAYALPYRSSDTRAADLPRWLRHYNHERPHASLVRQTPITWLQAQT